MKVMAGHFPWLERDVANILKPFAFRMQAGPLIMSGWTLTSYNMTLLHAFTPQPTAHLRIKTYPKQNKNQTNRLHPHHWQITASHMSAKTKCAPKIKKNGFTLAPILPSFFSSGELSSLSIRHRSVPRLPPHSKGIVGVQRRHLCEAHWPIAPEI